MIVATGGTGTITDRKMNGYTSPTLDTVNDYTLSTTTSGATNTYTVTRLLTSTDSTDYVIGNGTHNIVYAWGTGSFGYHSTRKGSFSIVVNIGSSASTSSSGVITTNEENSKNHGILLYIAWGWLCFFMILTGRYIRYFYFINTILHIIFA